MDRMHEMGSVLLTPGLLARGCILPWLLRAEASPCTGQKRVTVSHTASRPWGLSSETYVEGGTFGRHSIPSSTSMGYAASTKSQGDICLDPEKPTKPSSQLRNSKVRTERCETQNPKQLLRAPNSRP